MADGWQPATAYVGSHWVQDDQPCAPPSTFSDFIYAFPRPRLNGRVVKPRSAGNSPSSAGRRRTSTMPFSSPMHRQLPKQDYQTSLKAALLASTMQSGRRSRPISWHPASRQLDCSQLYAQRTAVDSYNIPVTQACPQPQQIMSGAFDDSMLNSYAPSEISMAQQNLDFSTADMHFQIQEPSYLQSGNPQFDGVSWDGTSPGVPSYLQATPNEWSFDMVSMNQSIPSVGAPASIYGSVSSPGRLTEPPTPEFLPIQQFCDEADSQSMPVLEKPAADDELVGMGLYNNPESFADGSFYGLNGKGLKLEETFTPSSDNEADDNDGEDDEQEEREIQGRTADGNQAQPQSTQHIETNKQPKPGGNMMQKSFFFEDDADYQQRVTTEPRPSFNFGGTSCMNYGYGWI
ncbi:hypothetical protein BJY01DRAFT_209085 [Aspergillus pseudoustus]|uniref:Uncharacterized protein n=1 Tax=Aspergillus pseudoustus TaxID=1810923 RepID=A0ABR4KGS5_9EURO